MTVLLTLEVRNPSYCTSPTSMGRGSLLLGLGGTSIVVRRDVLQWGGGGCQPTAREITMPG